jgi:MYXO-CTERM domain-containing protein
MQNPRFLPLRRILLAAAVLASPAAHAALIAHYTFDAVDAVNGTTTPDSVAGGAFATLNGLSINSTTGTAKVGAGALEMSGTGTGARTSNTFAWATDTRTIAFWWKTKLVPDPENPEASIPADTGQGTYVSMGGSGTAPAAANGRFDLRELGNPNTATLRLETQGGGNLINTTPEIDNGNWHLITVVVPSETATLGDVRAYVNGNTATDLFAGNTSAAAINTITSALVFGDSVLGGRVPNGYLDDFQLYDEALTTTQIQYLYNNPGSVVPEPAAAALGLVGVGAFFLRRRRA